MFWQLDLDQHSIRYSHSYAALSQDAPTIFEENFDHWLLQIHPEDRDDIHQSLSQLHDQSASPSEIEYRKLDPHGHWRWLRARCIASAWSNDQTVIAFIGLVKDITAEKQAQAQREKNASLLQHFSQCLPGMLYQFQMYPNGQFCFPYASDSIKDMFGLDASQVVQNANVLFERVHPDDLPELLEKIGDSARHLAGFQHEFRVVIAGAPERWYVGHSTPASLEDGSVLWHGF